jgi:hypothetical protein
MLSFFVTSRTAWINRPETMEKDCKARCNKKEVLPTAGTTIATTRKTNRNSTNPILALMGVSFSRVLCRMDFSKHGEPAMLFVGFEGASCLYGKSRQTGETGYFRLSG